MWMCVVSDVRVRYSCSLIEVSVRVMMSESALVWRAYCLQESTTIMRLCTLVYSSLHSSVFLFGLRSCQMIHSTCHDSRSRAQAHLSIPRHTTFRLRDAVSCSHRQPHHSFALSPTAQRTHTPAQLRTQHTAHDSPVSSPQPAASAAPMPAPCSRRAAARPPPASHVNYSVQPATRRSHARRRCDARGGAVPRVPGRRPVRVVVETRAEVREVPLAMRLPP